MITAEGLSPDKPEAAAAERGIPRARGAARNLLCIVPGNGHISNATLAMLAGYAHKNDARIGFVGDFVPAASVPRWADIVVYPPDPLAPDAAALFTKLSQDYAAAIEIDSPSAWPRKDIAAALTAAGLPTLRIGNGDKEGLETQLSATFNGIGKEAANKPISPKDKLSHYGAELFDDMVLSALIPKPAPAFIGAREGM
jgi:hypothetical protein